MAMPMIKKLTILHTNDMHGDFLPEDKDGIQTGGLARLSGYVDKVRAEEDNVVYAIAGEVKDRLCADILKAAETEPDKHRPEYEYYPTEWHEPYIGRRRELGYDLYAKLGIARDDVAARTSQMNRNYLFFDAPVGLFVTMDRRLNTGSYIDMGMFLQYILLAARGHGLHTCGQAAFTWYHDIIRKHLSFDDTEILICGVALGYEDTTAPENKLVTRRVPVDTYAKFLGFSGGSTGVASARTTAGN